MPLEIPIFLSTALNALEIAVAASVAASLPLPNKVLLLAPPGSLPAAVTPFSMFANKSKIAFSLIFNSTSIRPARLNAL